MPGHALEASLQSTDPIAVPRHLGITKDPWLAKSALQKSIRWGLTEDALRAAHMLLEAYSDSLFRRLAVIALEDVGIGAPALVAQTVWVAGKKAWRQAHGGDWHVAANLVQRMAEAPKSRDACELIIAAGWHPKLETRRIEFSHAETPYLAGVLADQGSSLPLRALAAWYLAGIKPGEKLEPRDGRFEDLKAVYAQLRVCPEVLEAADLGKSRADEAIGFPLAWLAYTRSTWSELVQEALPPLVRIGGWPAAAWDMHTRPGNRALARFATQCLPLSRFLEASVPPAERHELTGGLVFRVEGSKLRVRVRYEGSDDILRNGVAAHLSWASLPIDAIPEALGIVKAHLDLLNDIRRDIAA